ncbi:hypothetical protein HY387_00940 [Candidatus Daviesbacteria bacterium]|nr:hypothetical protein [Candidatus Daviesbacteria bacterium]
MREKLIWTGGGVALGLALRAAGEYLVITSNWPEHVRNFISESLQNPIISVASWLIPAGFIGLFGFFRPDAYRSTPSRLREIDRRFLDIAKEQRGSARIAFALAAGLLAAGVSAGALAEPAVNTAGQLISKIGEVAISSPVISSRGRFY